MSETRIEWGAELTWPDGHSEVRTHDRLTGKPYQRRDAELCVESNSGDPLDGDTLPQVSARLVQRTVVVGNWETPTEVEMNANTVGAVEQLQQVLYDITADDFEAGWLHRDGARRTFDVGDLADAFPFRSRTWIASKLGWISTPGVVVDEGSKPGEWHVKSVAERRVDSASPIAVEIA